MIPSRLPVAAARIPRLVRGVSTDSLKTHLDEFLSSASRFPPRVDAPRGDAAPRFSLDAVPRGDAAPRFSRPGGFKRDAPPASNPELRKRADDEIKETKGADGRSEIRSVPLSEFKISPELRGVLQTRFKITSLYPIQAEAFPPIVDGKDIIGRSKTGTGKTLAFCIPLVERLRRTEARIGSRCARVLVMEPTRELARQVGEELKKLDPKLRVTVVYGGADSHEQARELRDGVDFVIATPGRLIDHIDRGNIRLNQVETVVLDEADEMLKMGFQDDIEKIMEATGESDRQTLLFSATVPGWVRETSRRYMKQTLLIDTIGNDANASRTPDTIKHVALVAPRDVRSKAALALSLIQKYCPNNERALIFAATKQACSEFPVQGGFERRACVLHGDVSQSVREKRLRDFKAGVVNVLVATDVAARGIDIPEVALVIHDGFQSADQYTHRSGRTGRAGRTGTSLLLVDADDRQAVTDLSRALRSKIEFAFPPQRDHAGLLARADTLVASKKASEAFTNTAKALTEKHGTKACAVLLSQLYGAEFSPRSLLTSNEGFTTVYVRNPEGVVPRTARWAMSRIESVLESINQELVDDLNYGKVQPYSGGVFVDVPAEVGQILIADRSAECASKGIEFPETLPQDLFEATGSDRSYGNSRGASSSNYSRLGGGSRDRSSGRSGFGSNSGRTAGNFGFRDRERGFGGLSGGGGGDSWRNRLSSRR